MRLVLLAGAMLTLPAIAVIVFMLLLGRPYAALAALASFAVASAPFVVGLLFFRSRNMESEGGEH